MSHADDDPVLVSYASSRNISFWSRVPEDLGFTWGEWRAMTGRERDEALTSYLYGLVEIHIEGEE